MRSAYVLAGILLAIGSLDLLNVLGTQKATNAPEKAAGSTTNSPELWSASHKGVKIAFCTSWSMKGAFVQVRNLIESEFPGTEVIGTGYPVPLLKEYLSKAVFLAQLGVSAIALAGDSTFQALNMPPPEIYNQYRDKKMGVIVGVWILGNMVQNALTQTGAFEIYSCGELIFSKLEQGRMPSLDELMSELHRTLGAGS